MNKVYLMDCMEGMRGTPDGYYDLAVVDPPYGIGMDGGNVGYKGFNNFTKKDWDKETPTDEYFNELFRVSTNQIIFGGNYFGLPPTRCFLVWDKGEGFYNRTYAECELAWTSFNANTCKIKYDPLAKGDYKGKLHPCQKPIALYDWIFAKYANDGDKILDTHAGSMSSVISAMKNEMEITAYEIDSDYFNAGKKRIETYLMQGDMFNQPKIEFIS